MAAHGEFAHTEKQSEYMRHILEAADAGAFLTFRELHEKLSFGKSITLGAVKISVRHLVRWGLIEKEYGRNHTAVLKPTEKAYGLFRRSPMDLENDPEMAIFYQGVD